MTNLSMFEIIFKQKISYTTSSYTDIRRKLSVVSTLTFLQSNKTQNNYITRYRSRQAMGLKISFEITGQFAFFDWNVLMNSLAGSGVGLLEEFQRNSVTGISPL
jgi:hypothetical protein